MAVKIIDHVGAKVGDVDGRCFNEPVMETREGVAVGDPFALVHYIFNKIDIHSRRNLRLLVGPRIGFHQIYLFFNFSFDFLKMHK